MSREKVIAPVESCARCGRDHPPLCFLKLKKPAEDGKFTHWAVCPTTGEPIMHLVTETSPASH